MVRTRVNVQQDCLAGLGAAGASALTFLLYITPFESAAFMVRTRVNVQQDCMVDLWSVGRFARRGGFIWFREGSRAGSRCRSAGGGVKG